ncbi:unnamed protein product [Toxocara canis]|uniref:Pannexin_like domain-containing protein n=1 Tax=Toxocara canis TaxID=6265 RepID=A0A183U2D0_TOXCA|nr:unnamed protein product [Toxocara canis]
MPNNIEEPCDGDDRSNIVPSKTSQVETLEERTKRVFALTDDERKELRYRHLSSLSFIMVMIVFGIPLWWCTTSTYRVAFRNFSPQQEITIPIDVVLACWNRSLVYSLERISASLSEEFRNLPPIERLNLNFITHLEKTVSICGDALHFYTCCFEGRFFKMRNT